MDIRLFFIYSIVLRTSALKGVIVIPQLEVYSKFGLGRKGPKVKVGEPWLF
jgi:hypothetical protein